MRQLAITWILICLQHSIPALGQEGPQAAEQIQSTVDLEGIGEQMMYCYVSTAPFSSTAYQEGAKVLYFHLRAAGRESFVPALRFTEPQATVVTSGPVKGEWMICVGAAGWNPPSVDDSHMQSRKIPPHTVVSMKCKTAEVEKCGQALKEYIETNDLLVLSGPLPFPRPGPDEVKIGVAVIRKPVAPVESSKEK